ncbi:hypothetical protein HDV06_006690 [Boothiomyces sp. JEL0866]|nr:hypothetical protein HDV06_006690 [Boothiomyces sp. JEL0866]
MDQMKITDTELPGVIEAFLKEFMEKNDNSTPGAIITVVHKGKSVLQYTHGYANAETKIPVTADKSLFRIASVTKSFTAATLLTVWQNKGYSASDIKTKDVNEVIKELEEASPEFSIRFRIDDNGFTEPVTIWNLLTHTAGLEDAYLGMDSHLLDDLSSWNLDPRLYNRTHLLNGNFPKRTYPPNTIASYSNGGFILIGYIIELLCRKPYPDALHDTLFIPLGMNSSSAAINYAKDPVAVRTELPSDHADHLDYAEPHVVEETKSGEFIHKIMPISEQMRCLSMSDGSLALTPEDMAKYMICLLNAGRHNGQSVISPLAIELMTTKQFEKFEGFGGWANAGLMQKIAPEFKNLDYLQHGGFINGHLSQLMLVPKHELGIFFSVNANRTKLNLRIFLNLLFESVPFEEQEKVTYNYSQVPAQKIPLQVAPQSKFDLKKYSGYYRTTRFHHSTYLALFGMFYYPETKITVNKDGSSLMLKENELVPLYEGEKQLVFWAKTEKKDELPSNRYTTAAFQRVRSPQPALYLIEAGGAYQKLKWYERKLVHQTIYYSALGLATSQLAYGGIRNLFASHFASLPKLSIVATTIGLGITLFPVTNLLQSKTVKHDIDLSSKRPGLWVKSSIALSQTTVAAGAMYILVRLANRKVHVQEALALLAAGAYLGFLRYWNFEFWKLKLDLSKYAGYYTTTRKLETNYLAYFMGFDRELKVVQQDSRIELYGARKIDLVPVCNTDNQLVCWVKNVQNAKVPRNRYLTVGFKHINYNGRNFIYFETFRKIAWYERSIIQTSIYWSFAGFASSQIIFSTTFLSSGAPIAKPSVVATGIAVGITLFPISNFLYRHQIE